MNNGVNGNNGTGGSGDLLTRTFNLSLFKGKFDNEPQAVTRTWQEICSKIAKPQIRAEKDGPLFSPASFDPARRLKENVTEISELVLDFDHDADLDRDTEIWRNTGLAFAAYTTHSSYRVTDSNPNAEERFRLIIPLAVPIPAAKFPALWQWAAEMCDGKIDVQAKDSSRMFYTPAIASSDARYRFTIQEGEPLDWRELELGDAENPIPTSRPNGRDPANAGAYGRTALEAEVGKVLTAPVGNRNQQLFKSAAALGELVGGGVLFESDVVSALERAALAAGLEKSETVRTIKSGFDRGAQKPRKPENRGPVSPRNKKVSQVPQSKGSVDQSQPEPQTLDNQVDEDSETFTALCVLAGLADRLKASAKDAFEPEVVGALAVLKEQLPGDYLQAKRILQEAKIGVRDVEREIKKLNSNLRLATENERKLLTAGDFLDDAPMPELVIPDGYRLKADATMLRSFQFTGFVIETIAHGALLITGRTRDIDGESEGLRLSWKRGGPWRHKVVDRGIVLDSRRLISLADGGFPVTSGDAKEQVDYFAKFEAENFSELPVARTTSHLGWQGRNGDAGFLIGHRFIKPDGEEIEVDGTADSFEWSGESITFRGAGPGDEQIIEGYAREGSLDGWIEAVAEVVKYPRVIFTIYAAAATPLLQILGLPNFIVDLSARTSQGKTTTQRAAASVWGNPDERKPGAALQTWDVTKVYVERASAVLSGLPLILDDTKRARDPRMIAETLYAVTSGRGRGRGTLQGVATTRTWNTVLLSSGEQPVTSFTNDGGTKMRVLEIEGAPFGRQDVETGKLVEVFNLNILANYGHAGPAFVRWLIENIHLKDEWKKEIRLRTEGYIRSAAGEKAGRLAVYAAVVAQAATLLHTALDLPWSFEDPIQHLWAEISGEADDAVGAKRALRHLLSWAWANESRFIGREQENVRGVPVAPPSGWIGRWDRGDDYGFIAFYPHAVKDLLEGQKFNLEAILGEWRDRNWIDTDVGEQKRFTKRVRIRGPDGSEAPHFYVINRDAIDSID